MLAVRGSRARGARSHPVASSLGPGPRPRAVPLPVTAAASKLVLVPPLPLRDRPPL